MKRFYKDERGSSLVLTIVAMTFISLLAVAVISMTVTNIRLKIAQKGSQKNFYNTDSIMDEVRAGVEDLAAQAAVKAYQEAFSYFSASLSESSIKLSDKYEQKFLEEMIKSISGGESSYGASDLYYKDEVLQSYLMKADGKTIDSYLLHNGSDAPGVQIDGKSYGFMKLENKTLLLKDVMVTKTEGLKNYKTTLTSDIRVTIPPMTAETYSEYLNYALIADNQIIADNSGSVEGNMYAGTVKRFDAGASNPETGILVHNGRTLNVKAKQLITRGDLHVEGGSTFNLDGINGSRANLWVENIFTKGNSKNTLNLQNTVFHVSDDMEIGGKNDAVTLTGEYLGYNYNENYTAADLTTVSKNSEFSSSILVNGLGADLDLTGLSTLILSGRTFISKKVSGATETDPLAQNNNDIAMGESLSVKGAQVAYYVPTDFVTVASVTNTNWNATSPNNDDPVAMTLKFRIPSDLTTEYTFDYGKYMKYLFGLDPNTATKAELEAITTDTNGNKIFDIMTYLNKAQPLEMYYRHDTAVDANAVTYFYLNFIDDDKMLDFYPKFQQYVPRYSAVKDVNAAYMGTTGVRIDHGNAVYHYSGNVLYRDSTSSDTKIKLGNESITVDSQTLQRYAKDNTNEYLSRQLSLVENYQLAKDMVASTPAPAQYRLVNKKDENLSKSGTKDNTNIYNVLIDAVQMAAKTGLEKNTNDSDTGIIVIEPRANQTYTWNQSEQDDLNGLNCGIIISAGDVKLEKNFSGLIIAGGDIIFGADNVKVSSDNVLLEQMFTEDKALDTPLFYNLFSNYFQEVLCSAIGQEDDATKDVVFYESWKKE